MANPSNSSDSEIEVIELGEEGLWIERHGWICGIEGEGDEPREISLGAYFRITDMLDAGAFEEDYPEAARPWLVEAMIYPRPEELSEKFKEGMGACPGDSREALIGYMVSYISGTPFDSQSVQPAGRGFSVRIPGLKMPAGIEMPCFETEEEALAFCRERIGVLPAVFGLIGFYLDLPVNRLGNTGWDQIYEMVKNKRMIDLAINRMKGQEANTLRDL